MCSSVWPLSLGEFCYTAIDNWYRCHLDHQEQCSEARALPGTSGGTPNVPTAPQEEKGHSGQEHGMSAQYMDLGLNAQHGGQSPKMARSEPCLLVPPPDSGPRTPDLDWCKSHSRSDVVPARPKP